MIKPPTFEALLKEHAFSKDKIWNKVLDQWHQIALHLLKLMLVSDQEPNISHWATEIWAFISNFNNLIWKKTKRALPFYDYYDALFEGPLTLAPKEYDLHALKSLLEEIAYKYPKFKSRIINLNKEEAFKKLDDFYSELSIHLSNRTLNQVVLEELLTKHIL